MRPPLAALPNGITTLTPGQYAQDRKFSLLDEELLAIFVGRRAYLRSIRV